MGVWDPLFLADSWSRISLSATLPLSWLIAVRIAVAFQATNHSSQLFVGDRLEITTRETARSAAWSCFPSTAPACSDDFVFYGKWQCSTFPSERGSNPTSGMQVPAINARDQCGILSWFREVSSHPRHGAVMLLKPGHRFGHHPFPEGPNVWAASCWHHTPTTSAAPLGWVEQLSPQPQPSGAVSNFSGPTFEWIDRLFLYKLWPNGVSSGFMQIFGYRPVSPVVQLIVEWLEREPTMSPSIRLGTISAQSNGSLALEQHGAHHAVSLRAFTGGAWVLLWHRASTNYNQSLMWTKLGAPDISSHLSGLCYAPF